MPAPAPELQVHGVLRKNNSTPQPPKPLPRRQEGTILSAVILIPRICDA